MTDNENITVNVEIDSNGIETQIGKLSAEIGNLKTIASNINGTLAHGFDTNMRLIKDVATVVGTVHQLVLSSIKTLEQSVKLSIADVVTEVKVFHDAFNSVQQSGQYSQMAESSFNVMSKAVDWTLQMCALGDNTKNANSKNGGTDPWVDVFSTPKALQAGQTPLLLGGTVDPNYKASGPGDSGNSSNSLVSGLLSDAGNILPDKAAVDEMATSMGNLVTKIKESVTAWAGETAAKAASYAESMKIVVANTVEHVKAFGKMIAQLAVNTGAWIANTAAKVASTAAEWAQIAATTAWQGICIAATAVTTAFGAAVSFLTSPIGLVVIGITALIAITVLLMKNWDTVKAAAISVWEAIKNAFGKAWQWFKDTLLDPLVNGFKGMVNGIIGFLNSMISGIVSGINGIINLLNKLKIDIPDWVPIFGGQTFGFSIKPLTAPQIPYLAKGAVLPANRPFLAVVGDQRHGTNVEAPLATIQEAVGLVMNDHISAMMAGFRALLEEQQATRRTIEGIEIGDRVIGEAAQRYQRKMAVTYGTF